MKKTRKQHLRRLAERKDERSRSRLERNSASAIDGTLKMSNSGFGFVTPVAAELAATNGSDVFIPPKFIADALDGDLVRVRLAGDTGRGPSGRIIEVLERKHTEFVGELLQGSRVRALDHRLPADIFVAGSRHGAVCGDWVKLRMNEMRNGAWYAQILHVIGREGRIAADLDAIAEEFDLLPRYSAEEDAAALRIVPREIPRSDSRDRFAVTIDPEDAKDFDDAVSIGPSAAAGCVEVGVYISDVAAYIAPKSRFDLCASRRGFSCYLPGRTLPMLPPALTAKISLTAGNDQIVHAVFLTVDAVSGEVVNSRREHTLIRVRHRLDYPTVQELIDHGKAPAQWSEELKRNLLGLVDVTRKMRSFRRENEKFIELPLPEVRVLCDEKNNAITGLQSKLQREAEMLIEECMLAANSAVGRELGSRSIPGLYRIHPMPEPERVDEFCTEMRDFFELSPGDLCDRDECIRFIGSLPDDPRRPVILSQLLRTMARATYSAQPLGHFALGKERYCHFTSPIRRYTDLLVHQQLWNADLGVRTRTAQTFVTWAERCSALEENADNASFAASDRMKLRFLEAKLEAGDETVYEGVVARITNAGAVVSIAELGLYGFVPEEFLNREPRQERRRETAASSLRCGEAILLQTARIDFVRGSAIFIPAKRR